VMTRPLIALALGAILLSVVLTPAWPWLHEYLTGEPVHFEIGRLIQPALFVSLVLVSAGIGVGLWMYRKAGVQAGDRPAQIDPLEYAQPALFRFLANKMWIDELYYRTVIAFSWMAARLSDWLDRYFWDGLVRGFGAIGQVFAMFTTGVDERGINAPSACWHSFFSTHGWCDYSDHFHSAAWYACGLHLAAKKLPRHCSDV